jgi:hypothetical protein
LLDRSKGRRQTKRDNKTDAERTIISSDLKHRANDARVGSSSYSNRRDQSGLNGCCTAMWKANGKTTTLSLFLDSLFPKTEISYTCEMLPLEIHIWTLKKHTSPHQNYRWSGIKSLHAICLTRIFNWGFCFLNHAFR